MAKMERTSRKQFNPITDNVIDLVRNDAVPQPVGQQEQESVAEISPDQVTEKLRPKREKFTKQMRYQVTPSEELAIKGYFTRISTVSGSRPTHSNMMRACFNLMMRAEERIADELQKAGIQRPVNEQVAILEFEEELSEVLLAAFKQIPLRE